MNFFQSRTLALTLALLAAGAAPAQSVRAISGKVHVITDPTDQLYYTNAYGRPNFQLWRERRGVTVTNPFAVDIQDPGYYRSMQELQTKWIPAPSVIDSYYLYYNPRQVQPREITLVFSELIVGIEVESDWPKVDSLLSTDWLIRPNVPRNNIMVRHYDLRGINYPLGRNPTQRGDEDWIFLHDDRKTLTVHLRGRTLMGDAGPGSQIRVITLSSEKEQGYVSPRSNAIPPFSPPHLPTRGPVRGGGGNVGPIPRRRPN